MIETRIYNIFDEKILFRFYIMPRHKTRKHKPHKHKSHAKPKSKVIVGIIHAEWCSACQDTMPEWEKMDKMFKSDHRVQILEVEQKQENVEVPRWNEEYLSHSHKKIASSGYPTIFKIVRGHLTYYNGSRDAIKLFNWVSRSLRSGGMGDGAPVAVEEKQQHLIDDEIGKKEILSVGGKGLKHKNKTMRRQSTQKWFGSKWLKLW
jgi:thiol-disulfide isomerase/thioredoxin